MSFKLVTLNNIVFADVTSSDVAEPCALDPAAWSPTTTYNAGDRCYLASTHTIYKSRIDANLNNDPTTHEWNGITGEWYNDGYTNKYRMIDKFTNTYCEATTLTGTIYSIDFTIDVGYANTLCLLELDADECIITQTDNGTSTVTYTETIRLSREASTSWWAYFFGQAARITTVYRTIPHRDAKIRIQLSAHNRRAKIGVFAVGKVKTFGRVKYGVESSIIDYSKKTVDDAGNVSLVAGKYSRRFRCDIYLDKSECDYAMNSFIAERGVPAIYVVDEDYQSLVVYGSCRNFSIYWESPTYSKGVVEIDGLT